MIHEKDKLTKDKQCCKKQQIRLLQMKDKWYIFILFKPFFRLCFTFIFQYFPCQKFNINKEMSHFSRIFTSLFLKSFRCENIRFRASAKCIQQCHDFRIHIIYYFEFYKNDKITRRR